MLRVDVLVQDHEPIAVRESLDGLRTQQLAQTHHGALQHLPPGDGQRVRPQGIGDLLRADQFAWPHDQHRKNGAVAWGQSCSLAVDRQRP